MTYNPHIYNASSESFIENSPVIIRDTGRVELPLGINGEYRPITLDGVPKNSLFDASSLLSQPIFKAQIVDFPNSSYNIDKTYKTVSYKALVLDTLYSNLNGAELTVFYDKNNDGDNVINNSDSLALMNGGSLSTSYDYDTLTILSSGSGGKEGLDSISTVLTSRHKKVFSLGYKEFICPNDISSEIVYVNPFDNKCLGSTVKLKINTNITSYSTINEVLWQDSTIFTPTDTDYLFYDVTGSGTYKAIISYYSGKCKDTLDDFPVEYFDNPSIEFDSNLNILSSKIIEPFTVISEKTIDITETVNGKLYLSQTDGQVLEIDLANSSSKYVLQNPLGTTKGIASLYNQVFVIDQSNKVVKRINTTEVNEAGFYPNYNFAGANIDLVNKEKRNFNLRKTALFVNPIDITIDNGRIMYVADNGLKAIRKIYNNTVSTIGNLNPLGTSNNSNFYYHEFNNIKAIALNNDNKLFVADGDTLKIGDLSDSTIIFKTQFNLEKGLSNIDLTQIESITIDNNGLAILSFSTSHALLSYNIENDSIKLFAGTYGVSGLENGFYSNAKFKTPIAVLQQAGSENYLVIDYESDTLKIIRDSIYAKFCPSHSNKVYASVDVNPKEGFYTWYRDGNVLTSTSNQVELIQNGTYTVTFTDLNYCTASKSMHLELESSTISNLEVYDSSFARYCENSDFYVATHAVDSGLINFNWLDKDKNVLPTITADSILINTSLDSVNYHFAVNQGSCFDTINIKINKTLKPILSISDVDVNYVCSDSLFQFSSFINSNDIVSDEGGYFWSDLFNKGGFINGSENDSTSIYEINAIQGDSLAFKLEYKNKCGIDSAFTDTFKVISTPSIKIFKEPSKTESLATTVEIFDLSDSTQFSEVDLGIEYNRHWVIDGPVEILGEGEFDSYETTDSLISDVKFPSVTEETRQRNVVLHVWDKDSICPAVDTLKIAVVSYKVLYIPNAFSPNTAQEEENRVFKCYGVNISDQNFELTVYNRWGEVVYSTTDYYQASDEGWNGRVNNTGEDLESGVYTYILKGKFSGGIEGGGDSFSKTGAVTLIR